MLPRGPHAKKENHGKSYEEWDVARKNEEVREENSVEGNENEL